MKEFLKLKIVKKFLHLHILPKLTLTDEGGNSTTSVVNMMSGRKIFIYKGVGNTDKRCQRGGID